jgi:hypothetical protein
MSSKYLIADEPRPSTLGQHVVNPQWPMLAQMLAGTWLALPWFVFNSFAIGSPNRNKDIGLAIASVAGSIALLYALDYLIATNTISGIWIPLSFLTIVALRLYIAYLLFFSQSTVFELWQYYGGVEKNGMIFLILGSFLGRPFLSSQITNDFLRLILF